MGSYNYLGFSEKEGSCAEASIKSIRKYGCGVGGARHDVGKEILKQIINSLLQLVTKRIVLT